MDHVLVYRVYGLCDMKTVKEGDGSLGTATLRSAGCLGAGVRERVSRDFASESHKELSEYGYV